MGGSTIETKADKVANIQIQTSSYGLCIPVIYGTARVSANLIWFGNFTAIAHTEQSSQGGKGLGKVTSKNTTYTYTAAAIMALGQGVISGIGSVWRDKDKTTLADLGLTLFTGTPTQPVWSFLTSWNVSGNWGEDLAYGYTGSGASFTDQAINYSEIAYVAASAYDLGDTASVPNHGFEAFGKFIFGSGIQDANPADIVPDMLSSSQYGLGFAAGQIADLSLYSTYCRAAGLFVSPVYDEQRPGSDCLGELVEATNAEILWSGGKLKILPRGDTPLTGNGATYTPDLTPLYDLTDDDFLDPENPVRIHRRTPADAKNRLTLEFLNRANQYNAEVVSVEDQDAIERYGLKQADSVSMPMFKDAAAAKFAAQLQLQRGLNIRNDYDFDLGARYARLEPGDIVTLTDLGQDLYRQLVKLTLVNEEEDGYYCEAEELPVGSASAARYAHDNGLRWQSVVNQTPQNCAAPIIFELPADPSATGLSVAIAAGGQTNDPLYGGCRVWLSLDGTTYKAAGIIYGSSRYGLTTASLAANAPGVDNAHTLAVALRSNGQLSSGSPADRNKGTTLIKVGSEYLAYQTATLTGTNAYNLTSLNRGLYGTDSASAKANGTPWVRVDEAIAALRDLDLTLIGQTIYIKLTAFNTYVTGEQDLASVSAYTYTITGDMKALETPVDFLTEVSGAEKPANNATADLLMYDPVGGVYTAHGNKVTHSGGTIGLWPHNAYSTQQMVGTAIVSGVLDTADTFLGLGPLTATTPNGYAVLPASVYRSGNGHWYIYEAGASVDLGTGFSASDIWTITYDGAYYRYYATSTGATPQKITATTANQVLRAAVSIYSNGSSVSGIRFGAYTDNLWASVGGAGKPQDDATRNVNRGPWSGSSIAYVIGDEVHLAGSTWASITNHTSTGGNGPPTLPTTSNTNWTLRAKVGDPGATGSAGANGLSVAATKPIISVQTASGGAPLSGQLPRSTQMILFDGFTNVTATATYSRTQTNCSVTNDGGGQFTVTGISAGGGFFVVTATYGSRSITMTIPVAVSEKGAGAISATPVAITALTTSGTFTLCATLADLSVPDGSTLSGAMTVSYGPTVSGNYTPEIKLTYQNITDSGAETDFSGSTVTGGNANTSDPDYAATGGSVVNSAGGTKTFRVRAYARRAAGSGSVSGAVSGNLSGGVS